MAEKEQPKARAPKPAELVEAAITVIGEPEAGSNEHKARWYLRQALELLD